MKVELWAIGKTSEAYLEAGIEIFSKRLRHYLPFSISLLPDVKLKGAADAAVLKKEEGKAVLAKLAPGDWLVLLDERGQHFSSVEMARWLEKDWARAAAGWCFSSEGLSAFLTRCTSAQTSGFPSLN
jgi:Uncharacterized conserved protein